MPTYEYACDLCGHQLEIFQSIRDERLVTCPSCLQNGLRRLIGTGAGIIFKGSGFYQTDYKSSGPAKSEGGEKTSESTSSSATPAASTSTPTTSGAASASPTN